MKLALRRVSLPSHGAANAQRAWPHRHYLLLCLADVGGARGVGEASPLPGYSRETLDEAEHALARVSADAVASALDAGSVWAALSAVGAVVPSRVPSARMALETAALDLLGHRHAMSAPRLLGAPEGATRGLAALVGAASSPTLVGDCEQALADGFRCLKIKLGAPGELERELGAVAALRQRMGPTVQLRLDANGSLTSEQLARAAPALAALQLELLEEPGSLPTELARVLPLALDESLQGLDAEDVVAALRARDARALVLKPTALGGLAHCARLAERARAEGRPALISHCFDGPFAWRAAAALALALPSGPAHGLGPHAGLGGWSMAPLPVVRGTLQGWTEPGLGEPAEHGFS